MTYQIFELLFFKGKFIAERCKEIKKAFFGKKYLQIDPKVLLTLGELLVYRNSFIDGLGCPRYGDNREVRCKSGAGPQP